MPSSTSNPRKSRMGRNVRLCRRRAALKRAGRKARRWAKVRRELKAEFEARGITRCEVCGADDRLGFAHSRKRRNITTDEEMREVALLCNTHHDELELQGEEKMRPQIQAIIRRRAA